MTSWFAGRNYLVRGGILSLPDRRAARALPRCGTSPPTRPRPEPARARPLASKVLPAS